jgi:hypothetical protein
MTLLESYSITELLMGFSIIGFLLILIIFLKPWFKVIKGIPLFNASQELIVIIGSSRIAFRLAHDAADKGKKVVLISESGEDTNSDQLSAKGIQVLHKKKINSRALLLAGINKASSCLVVAEDDELNITISDFISKIKKKKGSGKKLNLIVHVQNWYTRNLLIDQISSFNSTQNLSIRFFDMDQSVAKLVYDNFPPHLYVNDETKTNDERVICIVGMNKVAEAFILENVILSHFPKSNPLKIFFLCEGSRQVILDFNRKFPALAEFISLHPVELLNTSFSSQHAWDTIFIDSIQKIDAAYFFGLEDAKIVSTSLHFRQFLYEHTRNIRKVPLIITLPEKTKIFDLLDKGSLQGTSIVDKYKDDLMIHMVRTFHDTCTYEGLISQNNIEVIAKAVNYFYAIKYEFDAILHSNFKKNNNSALIEKLEEKYLNFKVKQGRPLEQLEAIVIEAVMSYTKNSKYRVKQFFGIEERWNNVSERNKESNRYVARHLPVKLSILKTLGITEFTEDALKKYMDVLSPIEHNRWSAEKLVADFSFGELPANDPGLKKILRDTLKIHDQLKRFDQLDNLNKEKDIDMFLLISLLVEIKNNI